MTDASRSAYPLVCKTRLWLTRGMIEDRAEQTDETDPRPPEDRWVSESDWPWIAAGAVLFAVTAVVTYLTHRG